MNKYNIIDISDVYTKDIEQVANIVKLRLIYKERSNDPNKR